MVNVKFADEAYGKLQETKNGRSNESRALAVLNSNQNLMYLRPPQAEVDRRREKAKASRKANKARRMK